jgi:hypothetical protein
LVIDCPPGKDGLHPLRRKRRARRNPLKIQNEASRSPRRLSYFGENDPQNFQRVRMGCAFVCDEASGILAKNSVVPTASVEPR